MEFHFNVVASSRQPKRFAIIQRTAELLQCWNGKNKCRIFWTPIKPQTMQTRRVPPLALMGSSFVDFRFLFFTFFSFGWEKCFAFRGREEEEPRDTREKKRTTKAVGNPPNLILRRPKKKNETKQKRHQQNNGHKNRRESRRRDFDPCPM